jgi:hypothetical protein
MKGRFEMLKKEKFFAVLGNISKAEKIDFKFSWSSPLGEYIKIYPIRGMTQLIKQFILYKYNQIFRKINTL